MSKCLFYQKLWWFEVRHFSEIYDIVILITKFEFKKGAVFQNTRKNKWSPNKSNKLSEIVKPIWFWILIEDTSSKLLFSIPSRKFKRDAIITSQIKILTNNFQQKELEGTMHEPKLIVAEDSFIGMGKGLGGRW